ncbi:MAG: DUF72 domain-containing protein [Phycisphaerae bacterium]|nr:DUF72 domain-containing protein [Phycisphaerae bacterium]
MDLVVPEKYRPYLRIGTCSWKFDAWKGLIYDPDKPYGPDDYLPDYTRHFNSVEIDQWFWSLFPGGVRLPDTSTVHTYVELVPDDFVFTVKAPNALTLTHFYARQPRRYADFANRPNDHFLDLRLLEQFLDLVSPMDKKLGPIIFQFEYLNRQKMNSPKAFLDRLQEFFGKAPKGFRYAIETRNPNYLSDGFFECLRQLGLGFVFLEGYYMPPIGEVFDRYHPQTADFSIVRLHGPDRAEIEQQTDQVWDRIVSPKPEGLNAAARIGEFNASRKVLTYVNINNHFEGCAPISAQRFVGELGRR